jgi:phosphopantothenoylcysteine synthetase/decarboxylase
MWTNVRIVLGVSAGIAIDFLPDLIAALREQSALVDAILTPNACQMVSPLYVSALTGRRVYWDEMTADAGWEVPHINLVRDAALFLAAPATANLVAKFAHGIADNLATTAFVACRAPRLVCPAMHPHMWEDPFVQNNVAHLRQNGVIVVDPVFGRCATGDAGIGAMAPPASIVDSVARALGFE